MDVKLNLCLLIDLFICCVLIEVQPASFHQRKDTLKQPQSSKTKTPESRKNSKVVKIVISLSHLPPPPSIKLIRLFFGVNENSCRCSVLVSCMVPTGLIELWWSYSQPIVKATGIPKNLTQDTQE